MNASARRLVRQPGLLIWLAVFLPGLAFAPRMLHATASGCSRVANTAPVQESLTQPPECNNKGDGCYQCAYPQYRRSQLHAVCREP